MERKSYDPRITDVNDPMYTALNAFGGRVDMTMLLTDDAYFMGGFVLYDLVKRIEEVNVESGDQVVLGQRFGIVKDVYRDGLVLLGIRVQEHLPYVPISWRNNVEDYYGEGGTIRGRDVVYLFRDPDGEDVGGSELLTNLQSGGLPIESIYRGTLKVLHKQTADTNTWNDIMQSVSKYQSKFDE
jgi:hypothetical protein